MDTSPSSVPQTDEDCKMVGTASPRTMISSAADLNDNYRTPAKPSSLTLAKLSQGAFSSYNRSVQNSPNYAEFYFIHPDTDSEHDGAKALDTSTQKTSPVEKSSSSSSSSEEDWTFTSMSPSSTVKNRSTDSHVTSPVNVASENETLLAMEHCGLDSTSETDLQQDNTGSISQTDLQQGKKSSIATRLDFVTSNEASCEQMLQKIETSSCRKVLHSSKEEIQKLVLQAEEMVREDPRSEKKVRGARVFSPLTFEAGEKTSRAKYNRIKEWLTLHPEEVIRPQDSCDASGEYTTGDSDEDGESNTSEDQNGSIATCKQIDLLAGQGISSRSCSAEAFFDPEATPVADKRCMEFVTSPEHGKVVMRAKRGHSSGQRPWSVSDASISQLVPEMVAQFSISESALHKMTTVTTPRPALSSTTMEEGGSPAGPEGSGSGSGRRRKLRTRRRIVGRKSESGGSGGSDSQPQRKNKSSPVAVTAKYITSMSGYEHLARPLTRPRPLTKSESFYGFPSVCHIPNRLSSSAPTVPISTSGTTTEEEEQARLPRFRLGYPVGGTPWKGDGATEEQLSLFSDQAWDNYQEKYLSEPYSEELADPTRLLEFGDDYSNFLDSQSDCMSSLSTNNGQNNSPAIRRKRLGVGPPEYLLDSDSDLEDVQHLFQQSFKQYKFAERVFMEQCASPKPDLVLNADFAELIATCRENIRVLNILLDNVRGEGGLLSAQEHRRIRCLVEHWEDLRLKAEDKQRFRILERQICTVKDEIQSVSSRVSRRESFRDCNQLDNRIEEVKEELRLLSEIKNRMLDANVKVHRFQVDSGNPTQARAAAELKEQIVEVYKMHEETFEMVSDHMGNLQRLAYTWHQFDTDMLQLQHFLRDDWDKLDRLSCAMRRSSGSPEIADSLRNIAKTLYEASQGGQKSQQDQMEITNDDTSSMPSLSNGPASLNTEGSLSDSGISDSGSEQDLSDREKRLHALKRLVKNLEAALEPGSLALSNILKRMKQTELELERIKNTCNDLVVRSSVPSELDRNANKTSQRPVANGIRRPFFKRKRSQCSGSPSDPDSDKSGSWVWRVFRASLPFHIALFALICMACLLEPRCCEAINNLNLSFSPQLRYVRGPPPI